MMLDNINDLDDLLKSIRDGLNANIEDERHRKSYILAPVKRVFRRYEKRQTKLIELIKSFADHAEDSGWPNTANELRRKLNLILNDSFFIKIK